MTSSGCEYKRCRWYVRYMGESNADPLVPSALPVPLCRCGMQAKVKQSRHPKTAGRVFYVCKWTFDPIPTAPCDFFQWMDRPDKYDPRIRLFPYDSTKLKPLDGWPLCDFNEYIYGPKVMWPTEEQVWEFESGKAPWPCVSSPSRRCKCGILATKGVVPSELGYGSFCGNGHGEFWVSNYSSLLLIVYPITYFSGRRDLLLKLGRRSEPWKSRQTQELIEKIRKEYDVPIPDSNLLWGEIYQDMVWETRVKPKGLYAKETIIKYWR
uniref:GRF-type domain-containing protein n=1 Tax=Setaria viridis TaxID=4556 RepID=A0A4U6WBJ3_SETVI|nr:hypothetical protein SEVIR_1G153900v2 [Setaria viridis]